MDEIPPVPLEIEEPISDFHRHLLLNINGPANSFYRAALRGYESVGGRTKSERQAHLSSIKDQVIAEMRQTSSPSRKDKGKGKVGGSSEEPPLSEHGPPLMVTPLNVDASKALPFHGHRAGRGGADDNCWPDGSPKTTIPAKDEPKGKAKKTKFALDGYDQKFGADRVAKFRAELGLPLDIECRAILPGEKPSSPPEGCIAMSRPSILYGGRFPFQRFMRNVFIALGIAPGQLNPIGFRILAACWVLWKERQFKPDLDAFAFLTLYSLNPMPKDSGLYYFKSHEDRRRPLIENLPSSSDFKEEYFWLSGNYDPESSAPDNTGLLPRHFAAPIREYSRLA